MQNSHAFSFWNKRRLTFSARKGVALKDTDPWMDISAASVAIPELDGNNRLVVPSGYFVEFEEMSKRRRFPNNGSFLK